MAGSKSERTRTAKDYFRSRAGIQQRRQHGNRLVSGACPRAVIIAQKHLHHDSLNGNSTWTMSIDETSVEVAEQYAPTSMEVENCRSLSTPECQVLDAAKLIDGPEQCNNVIEQLENGTNEEKHALLLRLHKDARRLALSKSGCRIIQKALEVAGGSDRDLMIAELRDHIVELYESPNGNHVLSRAIEVLPAVKTTFVVSALLGRGIAVSKHRYGCRIVCRLVEHCGEEQIGKLLDEILVDVAALARHSFGTFVVQTALEHTSHARRCAMLSNLLPEFATLSTHRSGSLVAQRVLDHCDEAGQNAALYSLVQGDTDSKLVDVACSRYGCYVLEQIASMRASHSFVNDIGCILSNHLPWLYASDHAQRVIEAFGLAAVAVGVTEYAGSL